MTVRHAHLTDLPGVYDVCHLTGDAGRDATPVVSDRTLLGHYFAAPYVAHRPDWCWIAADDHGVVGYLVTTPDTRAFVAWMNEDWLPALRTLFPTREDPRWSPTEAWIRQTIHADATVPAFVDDYPAHLHIDFLPRAQGQGLGSRLLGLFVEKLRQERVPGFHLGVGTNNPKAQGFYEKQGLKVIEAHPGVVWMGLHW